MWDLQFSSLKTSKEFGCYEKTETLWASGCSKALNRALKMNDQLVIEGGPLV